MTIILITLIDFVLMGKRYSFTKNIKSEVCAILIGK